MAKAYLYNAWSDALLTHIYTWSTAVGWSANHVADVAFDYFPDACAVNDCVYFMDDEYFRNIRLFVGTQFAATSVTFTWEYFSDTGDMWVALSNVVNANAMENANQQDVTWDIPEGWRHTTVNAITYRLAIRCRISAINTPTEGGTQGTQKVFAGDNKIIATGGIGGDRLTIADIYAADVAAGWGVLILRFSNLPRFVDWWNAVFYFYECFAKIEVGDGGTQDYFDFPRRNTLFMSGAGNFLCFLKTDALFGDQYGEYSYIYNGIFGNDRVILTFLDANCDVTAYNTIFAIHGRVVATGYAHLLADGIYTDCIFYAPEYTPLAYIRFQGACSITRGVFGRRTTYDIHDVNVTLTDVLLQSTTLVSYVSGLVLDSITRIPDGLVENLAFAGTLHILDATGVNACAFVSIGATTNVKWRFDLKVIDGAFAPIVGATVTIDDVDGVEIFSGNTDASGDIAQQQITQLTHTTTTAPWHIVSFDDFISKTPHTVTISKAGYATRVMKYTMDRKREEIEKLIEDGTNIYDTTLYDSTIY